MPPDLALPALRALAATDGGEARTRALQELRQDVPRRTLINAYVLPSLTVLGLFAGTLRRGVLTRYGKAISDAPDEVARQLFGRHLLELDTLRVGFVSWLSLRKSPQTRGSAARRFVEDALFPTEGQRAATLDRLGKWIGYLTFFGVIREDAGHSSPSLTANPRQVAALRDVGLKQRPDRLPRRAKVSALLAAYAATSRKFGTRLYLPIVLFRDQLGLELKASGSLFTDSQLDALIVEAPDLLGAYLVSFSPFSGPARGGLQVRGMYAGFISIRPRPKEAAGD